MVPKVIVRHLRKRYGGVEAARDVSFDVEGGQIFGLLGPNGAGKTTTIECVLGLREPDGGAIEICGIDARHRPRDVKERVGAALQSTSLQDKLTPREALDLFASFYRAPAAVSSLLDRFGLDDKADASFETLSGGQRQRLALALAFVNNPELVFLDEPTAGLDPQSRRELHEQILRMKHDGHTVMLTTHYIEEAEQLCDRIAIIHQGRIVATGSPKELIAGFSAMQTISVLTAPAIDAAAAAALPGAQDATSDGERLDLRTADVTRTLAALIQLAADAKIEILELHVQKATLEQVFLEQTQTRAGDSA
jgi:ABC-2 type transport system ATP-binding protein